MDTIIRGYVDNFLENYGLEANHDNSKDFEKFCSYVVFSNGMPNQSVNIDDIENTTAEQYKGIDSICFIVNGKLVNTLKEIEDIKENISQLAITVSFIQAKTSEKFKNEEIANLCDTIKDFLSEKPEYPMTSEAEKKHGILLFVYSNLANINKFNSRAYYCTTGKWQDDKVCTTTIDKKTKEINDNVRDDLGENNSVNSQIDSTLAQKKYISFQLLNNGITIIAEKNEGTGNKFILENFQIVNGCQTSNILYKYKDVAGIDKLDVPIKIIISSNEDIKSEIIKATNNQTEIKEEQLLALTDFQKGLEEYYKIISAKMDSNLKLYYERRVNQYAGNTSVKKKSIIDLREQIKSYASIFLEEPHEVSGYFGKIYKKRKMDFFLQSHKCAPYYLCGLISYVFKSMLARKEIDRKYNKARYHLFMLLRKIHEPEELSTNMLSSNKIEEYCDDMIKILRDETKSREAFAHACNIIEKSGIDINIQKEFYKKSTTNKLLETFKSEYK